MQPFAPDIRFRIILRTLTGLLGGSILIVCMLTLAALGFHGGSKTFYMAMAVLFPLGLLSLAACIFASPILGLASGSYLTIASMALLFADLRDTSLWFFFIVFGALGLGIVITSIKLRQARIALSKSSD